MAVREVPKTDLNMKELLMRLIQMGGSDLHIAVGLPPVVRVDGRCEPLPGYANMSPEQTQELVYSVMKDEQIAEFEREKECDLSFGVKGLSRFRLNVFRDRGSVAAAFRTIPFEIRSFEELGLPKCVADFAYKPNGLVLVCGPTGSGKSSTLAAIIDKINRERDVHIITIEDPIEFLHTHKKSVINQRELNSDTKSFSGALKRVLRQDPDVILIGEMRDKETIQAALTVAETGHLAFATLHTNDALQTMNRIIDVFPAEQQSQIRTQLSFVVEGVIVQQLLPRSDGRGRALGMEIMLANPAIRALIRSEKLQQIPSIIEISSGEGMMTMNQSLYRLYKRGIINYDIAMERSSNAEGLQQLIDKGAATFMSLAGSLQALGAANPADPDRSARGDLGYDRHVMWLRYLGVARIGVLSFLAVGAAFMDLDRGQNVLLGFYILGFVTSVWYLLTLQRHLRLGAAQCWIQLLVDFAVVAVTVGYTQGANSFFTFMFVVVVLEAGLLLGLSQGFVLASMAAAFLMLQVVLPASTLSTGDRFEVVYKLLVQALSFYLTAFISGYWNQRINRLHEFQREILDNMNSGFLITDLRGNIAVLNKSARGILGLRSLDAGRPVSSVLKVASGGESPIMTALRSGQDYVSYEFEALKGSGEPVLLGLTTNRLRDASGEVTGVIASFTDLTEMHAMREELRRHDRLAVVGELAAGLAHEIRNPVAVIRGALEEMGRGGPLPPALEQKLRGMAIRESDHLNEIVTGFLNFAREPSRKRKAVDVRTLVNEVADLVRREHEHAPALAVRVECPANARLISCDPSQMKQVFVNLAKNAVEAMNNRGALEISVNEGPGLVEVRFDDEGPGIEPDKVARIFEPFFTTKDTGTGMGLAVCMRIVTAHDGTLRATARRGGGCSMRMTLPAAGQ